jgi:hypothetical protein
MSLTRWIKSVAVALALAGVCLPESLLAAGPGSPSSKVTDVALRDGGVLTGQVVDAQGAAKGNTPVMLMAGEQELAASRTDQAGDFSFRGLRGGVYQIAAGSSHGVYRLWAPDTAPPSAQQGVLIVSDENTVRGQTQYSNNGLVPGTSYGGRLRFWLSNPWVIGGIVATAVAVPIALHESNDHPHSP